MPASPGAAAGYIAFDNDEAVERSRAQPDVPEPHALSVATVDADGMPDVRTVLMRVLDERGVARERVTSRR